MLSAIKRILCPVKPIYCDCMGCRGECSIIECSVCKAQIIEGHYDTWDVNQAGSPVCAECVSNGAKLHTCACNLVGCTHGQA